MTNRKNEKWIQACKTLGVIPLARNPFDGGLASGQFTASPLAFNNKIWCFGERGEAVAVKAGDAFEVVVRNELGELIMATPAIAGDSLIIRTDKHVYCVRK